MNTRSNSASARVKTACVSLLAVLAGCEGPEGSGRSATPDSKVESHFGAEALAIIAGATNAEGYRLEPEVPGRRAEPGDGQRLGRFKVQSGPLGLRKSWRRQLEEILFAAASYEWDIAKGCRPTPGVAVRYRQGDKEVHVYLCFECSMLQIGQPGAERWEDFDPARPELVRLVKLMFPGDPAIQALKEES